MSRMEEAASVKPAPRRPNSPGMPTPGIIAGPFPPGPRGDRKGVLLPSASAQRLPQWPRPFGMAAHGRVAREPRLVSRFAAKPGPSASGGRGGARERRGDPQRNVRAAVMGRYRPVGARHALGALGMGSRPRSGACHWGWTDRTGRN
jgi:hypothetical protein